MAEPGNQEYPTVIGPDAEFKGELKFDKGLRLQGKFEGQLKSSGKLHVAKDANLSGDVDASSVVIEGNVRSNLNVSDKVELKASAKYEGDLNASKLVVEEGAVFVGQVSVGPDAVKKGGSPSISRPAAPASQNQPQGQGSNK